MDSTLRFADSDTNAIDLITTHLGLDDQSDIIDICALIEQLAVAWAVENAVDSLADAIDAALALDGGIDAVFPHWDDNSSLLNYILMDVISTGGEEALDSVLDGLDTTFADSDTNAIDLITTHLGLMTKVRFTGT